MEISSIGKIKNLITNTGAIYPHDMATVLDSLRGGSQSRTPLLPTAYAVAGCFGGRTCELLYVYNTKEEVDRLIDAIFQRRLDRFTERTNRNGS